MADAAERKRAKEAYLKALEDQRQKSAIEAPAAAAGGGGASNNGPLTAAQKREAQLEERRRKFFENASKPAPSEAVNHAPVSAAPFNDFPFEKPVPAFQPQQLSAPPEKKEPIRPSDWKSKGYASEYAYMKAMGQLDIPSKPLMDLSSWAVPVAVEKTSDRSAQPQHNQFNQQNDFGFAPSFGEPDRQKFPEASQAGSKQSSNYGGNQAGGAGGLNFGAVEDKMAKKAKQAEYARALDQQATIAPGNRTNYEQRGQPSSTALPGGGGLNFGAPDDKELKRQKQAEYARALDQQQHQQPVSDQHQQQHRAPAAYDAHDPYNGGGGLNIGGIPDKELKRQKQAEYARALDQQAQYHAPAEQRPLHGGVNTHQGPSTDLVGGGGLNIGTVLDKDTKRQRQEEYARALDQQGTLQPLDAGRGRVPPSGAVRPERGQEMAGGGGLALFGAPDDKEAKRQKQAEYARALDQQAHLQPPALVPQREALHHHPHRGSDEPFAGGGNLNIGAVDDKDLKRQKQAEYARALDQQQRAQPPLDPRQQQQHQHRAQAGYDPHDPFLGGGGLNIGAAPDKETMRQKQAEYARALDQQAQQLVRMGDRAMYGAQYAASAHGGPALSDIGARPDKETAAELKRQQQQEYTRQLNAQAQFAAAPRLNRFGEYEQPGRHVNPAVSHTHAASDITNIGADLGKADKRAKQAEYALALQKQQFLHHAQQPAQENREHLIAAAAAPVGIRPDGGLEEGWVIGPLGLPVRKTLEVGNRKVQKAYADHALQAQSPKKASAAPGGYGAGTGGGGYGGAVYGAAGAGAAGAFVQLQQPSNLWDSPPKGAVGMAVGQEFGGAPGAGPFGPLAVQQVPATSGDAIGGNPDERALRVKQQQAEQARILEMQIRLNQERKKAEKEKLEEEERREIAKWEKHQAALKQQAIEEEQQRKAKIDEDNRRELARQIEQKRLEKEREAAAEKARMEAEEARVQREQELLRQREEQELQREAAAARKEKEAQLARQREEERQRNQVQAMKRQPSNMFDAPDAAPARPVSRQQFQQQPRSQAPPPDLWQPAQQAEPASRQQQRQQLFEPAQQRAPRPVTREAPVSWGQGREVGGMGDGGDRGDGGGRSAAGMRGRSHLFGAVESDADIFGLPSSRNKGRVDGDDAGVAGGRVVPSSPHKQKVEELLSRRAAYDHEVQQQQQQEHQQRGWQAPAPDLKRMQFPEADREEEDERLPRRNEAHRQRNQQQHVQDRESTGPQRATPPQPLLLNLSHLKSNIAAGAVSARGNSRSRSRAGGAVAMDVGAAAAAEAAATVSRVAPNSTFAPLALETTFQHDQPEPDEPHHPYMNLSGPSGPVPMQPQQPGGRVSALPYRDENQYVPPPDRLDRALLGSPNKTLKSESRFMLPDGTFMPGLGKPSTPALSARWNQLSKESFVQPSDNRVNSGAGSSSAMATLLSPSKESVTDSRAELFSPQSEGVRGLIEDFHGTLQLLQADEAVAQHRARLLEKSNRPSTSGSTASDFDLDRFNRRNERKWRVLRNVGGLHEDAEDDALLRGMRDVHSRPSTAASALGNAAALQQYEANGGSSYTYGRQSSAPLGIAAGRSSRPNSGDLAKRLMQMNGLGGGVGDASGAGGQQRSAAGYGARPRSGDRNAALRNGAMLLGRSGSQGRYGEMHASLEDGEFDRYSEYGL